MRSAVDYSQTSRKTYKEFCTAHPNLEVSYIEFVNVIYAFNYSFRDYLLETGLKGKLPWGIGDFAVSKNKPRRFKTMEDGYVLTTLPVDWKKTKLAGKKVYHMNAHTEGYKFRYKWFIPTARFRNSSIWTFKPSRITSRLIKHYVVNLNKQHSYYEWETTKK